MVFHNVLSVGLPYSIYIEIWQPASCYSADLYKQIPTEVSSQSGPLLSQILANPLPERRECEGSSPCIWKEMPFDAGYLRPPEGKGSFGNFFEGIPCSKQYILIKYPYTCIYIHIHVRQWFEWSYVSMCLHWERWLTCRIFQKRFPSDVLSVSPSL